MASNAATAQHPSHSEHSKGRDSKGKDEGKGQGSPSRKKSRKQPQESDKGQGSKGEKGSKGKGKPQSPTRGRRATTPTGSEEQGSLRDGVERIFGKK